MAEQAIGIGLQAVPLVSQHYNKVWDPIHHRYKKMTGQNPRNDPDVHDHRSHEEKGYYLRRRSELASDEEIVDTVRHRGEVVPRRPSRPNYDRRTSSMDNPAQGYGNRNRSRGGYESEGSVPPRSRTRQKSKADSKPKQRGSSTSSSTSSSELLSSSDEEKQVRKAQRKKWITAALASVATIHAAQKVYSSIESHDKRVIAVQEGKMSPEEAHQKQRSTRWQDAAAIGIAALGIKGAISEWNEVQEEHKEHKEMMEKKEQHHKKRLEKMRREKARSASGGGYYKGRDGNWYYDGYEPQDSERSRQLDGPRNGERKMLEGPSRARSRSAYGDRNGDYRNGSTRSRSRGARNNFYNDDDDTYYRSRRATSTGNNRRQSSRYSRDDDH